MEPPGRFSRIFTWDKNFSYAHSPVVKLASYAYLIVPLLAHLIVAAQHSAELALYVKASRTSILILENLFFSSALIILASGMVRYSCPDKIKKYPHVEDYFEYVLKLRTTIFAIQQEEYGLRQTKAEDDDVGVLSDSDTTQNILARIIAQEMMANIKRPNTIYQEWAAANTSKPVLRWLTGIFHAVGTGGIILYMIWSATFKAGAMGALL